MPLRHSVHKARVTKSAARSARTGVPRAVARRAAALRAEIRRHDERYYVANRPTISDAAYDRLVVELREIEDEYPQVATPASPTRRVAGRVGRGFRQVRHAAPMLSLQATRNPAEVRAFVARIAGSGFVLEPKLDGLSVEIVYTAR